MATGPRWPVQPLLNYGIPIEWDDLVCTCGEDYGTKHDLDRHHYMLCIKCDKLKRFYGSRCRQCSEFYLMVFKHPLWQPGPNLCFTCLPPSDEASYPEWATPKPKRTAEEIAADLDDFLADW